ncbi:hypothetical protein GIB67_003707 [Kingdonia uniflora]|uniref:Uncharacterized protein n=1 Tax=Kingdonia uniflora TaxID=39325 RepID=A0A7J7M3X0_9MAGN|nr:hypothetical protein GIB67_003707 [Kingdonia uniflora]
MGLPSGLLKWIDGVGYVEKDKQTVVESMVFILYCSIFAFILTTAQGILKIKKRGTKVDSSKFTTLESREVETPSKKRKVDNIPPPAMNEVEEDVVVSSKEDELLIVENKMRFAMQEGSDELDTAVARVLRGICLSFEVGKMLEEESKKNVEQVTVARNNLVLKLHEVGYLGEDVQPIMEGQFVEEEEADQEDDPGAGSTPLHDNVKGLDEVSAMTELENWGEDDKELKDLHLRIEDLEKELAKEKISANAAALLTARAEEGLEAVHAANPNVIVILSRLEYGKDFSLIAKRPLNLTFSAKLAFEAHWHGFSDGIEWDRELERSLLESGKYYDEKAGFLLEKGWPLFISAFGVDQRRENVNDNSYYLREGVKGLDETYVLLNNDWAAIRSPSFLKAFQAPFQGPGLSRRKTYNVLFHPSTGLKTITSFVTTLKLDSCFKSEAWVYATPPKDYLKSMRLKPSIHTSKFVVLSSSEETSSLGRGDECSVIEETVFSVGMTVEVGEPSRVDMMV